MEQTPIRGRDLAAERVRARCSQGDVAIALGMSRQMVSFIERERMPLNDEFIQRYLNVVKQLEAERETAGAA